MLEKEKKNLAVELFSISLVSFNPVKIIPYFNLRFFSQSYSILSDNIKF